MRNKDIIPDVKQIALNCLCQIEKENNCIIVLAGFIGSRMDGLSIKTSDYDVRAIAIGDDIIGSFFKSFDIEGIRIEILIHSWKHVEFEINAWKKLRIPIPSICYPEDMEIIHNDVVRSQIRLSSMHCILNRTDSSCDGVMRDGLLVKDGLDYEFARAYMNYHRSLSEECVSVRKYLYTINELYKIYWINENKSFPPDFKALLSWKRPDDKVEQEICSLLEKNSQADKENNFIKKNIILDNYIGKELITAKELLFTYSNNYEDVFEIMYE